MKKTMVLMLTILFLFSTSVAYANHNSGGDKYNNYKCEKAQKYLEKSENAKNEKYAEKYAEKYNKYNKYCDDNYNKKCEKALKYLTKSEIAKKEKYKQKYYQKYLKYSKYCTPVVPPNNPPVAQDINLTSGTVLDTYGNPINVVGVANSFVLNLITLPATDTEDTNSTLLQRVIVNNPSGGTLNLNNDGTITYTAPAVPGTYTFTFKVVDTKGLESNVATATVQVYDSFDF